MSAGRFRPFSRLLVFALAAIAGGACSLNTQATGASGEHEGGPGPGGGAGTAGGAVGGGGSDAGGSSGNGGTGALGGAPDGGNAGAENCLDGKDNDGNGYIDCADSACSSAGYTCEPSPPPGWQGYFRAAGAAYDTTTPPPTCPNGSPPVKLPSEPVPASCSQCTCGAMQGATCGQAHLLCSNSTDCSGSATDLSSQLQSCSQAGSPSQMSCRMQAVQVTGVGTCTPSGGQLQATDMWARWLYVCGAPGTVGGGCVPGKSCAAPGGGAYSGTVCIRKSGEQNCPPGWTTKMTGYQDGTDARGCTPCACKPDAASVACSTGQYTFYDHGDCSACQAWQLLCQSRENVHSTACVDVSNIASGTSWGAQRTADPAPAGGTCTPSGGAPTGSVQTTGAVTYCCR